MNGHNAVLHVVTEKDIETEHVLITTIMKCNHLCVVLDSI